MEIEQNEVTVFGKVSSLFRVMRNNLAITDAFFRYSPLSIDDKESKFNGGFLGMKPGSDHIKTQNQSILIILVACLYQALENYCDLKRVKPVLRDSDIESFLDDLKNKKDFIKGMRIIRNGVFHVNDLGLKTTRCIAIFDDICAKHGGVVKVMRELQQLLYDFTGKCFSGELQVLPSAAYEINEAEMEKIMDEIRQFQKTDHKSKK